MCLSKKEKGYTVAAVGPNVSCQHPNRDGPRPAESVKLYREEMEPPENPAERERECVSCFCFRIGAAAVGQEANRKTRGANHITCTSSRLSFARLCLNLLGVGVCLSLLDWPTIALAPAAFSLFRPSLIRSSLPSVYRFSIFIDRRYNLWSGACRKVRTLTSIQSSYPTLYIRDIPQRLGLPSATSLFIQYQSLYKLILTYQSPQFSIKNL